MNLQIENPIILGRIERHPAPRLVVLDTTDNNDIDNPSYDVFGSIIVSNDSYYVFDEHVVHFDNVHRYFEDFLKADYRVKK